MFFVLFIMINLYFSNFACKECGKQKYDHNTKRVLGGDSDMFIMDLEIHNLARCKTQGPFCSCRVALSLCHCYELYL